MIFLRRIKSVTGEKPSLLANASHMYRYTVHIYVHTRVYTVVTVSYSYMYPVQRLKF